MELHKTVASTTDLTNGDGLLSVYSVGSESGCWVAKIVEEVEFSELVELEK